MTWPIGGSSLDSARTRIHTLCASVTAAMTRVQREGITPGEAARRIVAERLADAGR